LLGFLVYHWVDPSPLEWWLSVVSKVVGTPLGEHIAWLPGSIPSFAIAFVASLGLARISSPGIETPIPSEARP
jgi:hypothetical protein